MKNLLSGVAKRGLDVLEKTATKKAEKECPGFLYEPKVPKKLKKTLCLALAGLLTAVTVLAGSTTNYYAADYLKAPWQTYARSSTLKHDTEIVSLYITTETYRWSVLSCSVPNGYGKVTLNGYNAFTTILNGENRELTQEGSRDFVIFMDTTGQTYAQFKITMSYVDYPTVFVGFIEIL